MSPLVHYHVSIIVTEVIFEIGNSYFKFKLFHGFFFSQCTLFNTILLKGLVCVISSDSPFKVHTGHVGSPISHVGLRWVSDQSCRSPMGLQSGILVSKSPKGLRSVMPVSNASLIGVRQ